MTSESRVFVGAASAGPGTRGGLYTRDAGEEAWHEGGSGLPDGTQVQSITVSPADSHVIYLGTHDGPYLSRDRGDHWERLSLPDPVQVWSVLVHPAMPTRVYAGTSPVGVYRSDDGGDTWERLPMPDVPERVKMGFPCRVMRLAVDPANADELYATLEVNGVMRSLDGGDTWEDCSDDLVALADRPHLKSMIQSNTDTEGMLDGHALCVSDATPGTVYLAVRMGLFRSDDRGKSWADMEVGRFSPLTYARDVRVSPQDPNTLYACFSPAARSEDGSVYRSPDLGKTWTRFDHDIKAEATMMAVALHPHNPNEVHCVSRCGQAFSTTDGGKSWQEHRLPEGVRDIYAVACV